MVNTQFVATARNKGIQCVAKNTLITRDWRTFGPFSKKGERDSKGVVLVTKVGKDGDGQLFDFVYGGAPRIDGYDVQCPFRTDQWRTSLVIPVDYWEDRFTIRTQARGIEHRVDVWYIELDRLLT